MRLTDLLPLCDDYERLRATLNIVRSEMDPQDVLFELWGIVDSALEPNAPHEGRTAALSPGVPLESIVRGENPGKGGHFRPSELKRKLGISEMTTEFLAWYDAGKSKPDVDITVLCWGSDGFFTGYWDDDINCWIGCESGGSVIGVTHWSEPCGPNAGYTP